MYVLGNEITSNYIKLHQKFVCENCDFNCFKKGDWKRHIMTIKHKETIVNKGYLNVNKKTSYLCDVCNKIYLSKTGLWKHQKICKKQENIDEDKLFDKKLIKLLINDNKEMRNDNKEMLNLLIEQSKEKNDFKTMIIDVIKNGITNNNNNSNNHNNINSLNKTFNLQFFLNETCKNAMNIMDFVESIKLQLPDLEKMGEIGYVQGLSNIITTNLKTLDFTQRPVHCMDPKRETIYIKDDNQWEKEDDNKTKLRKIINKIAYKNIKLLPQFREKYPEYSNSSLKISDTYDKLVVEVMGGSGDNDFAKENKIIHNISKCILINK